MASDTVKGLLVAGLFLAEMTVGAPGATAQSAGVIRPLGEAVAIDATGREIGPVIDVLPPSSVVVLVAGSGRTAPLLVGGDRLAGLALLGLLYPTTDCSGPAFLADLPLPPPFTTPALPFSGVGPDDTLVVAEGPAAPVIVKSIFAPSFAPPCQSFPSVSVAARATAPVMSVGGLVPPFGLR